MSLSYACVHEIYIWVSPSILAILLHVYCKHVKALIPGVHCSAIFYYWTVGVSVETVTICSLNRFVNFIIL